MNRIDATQARLKAAGRSGLATYFTAGDPDFETSLALLGGLADAGADLIELGLPFSDPVADGPTIQAAHLRARQAGQTVARTLELVTLLRQRDAASPVVLMGYLNPILQFGIPHFMEAAHAAGVDGLIIVDLPFEHATSIAQAARAAELHLIRMTAPTTDNTRLAHILHEASGFIYHVTLTGTTGDAVCTQDAVEEDVRRLRQHTSVPIALGFGIRDADQVRRLAGRAEWLVVGSTLVKALQAGGPRAALESVRALADAIQSSEPKAASQKEI